MRLRVVDFETTGGVESEVIEIGTVDVVRGEHGWRVEPPLISLLQPRGEIQPHARAVHHIGDLELAGAPLSSVALVDDQLEAGAAPFAFVAHNADFERSFVGQAVRSARWICTAKAARRAWPQAPGYANQVLRYWLELDLDAAISLPAHRAGPDAYVTAHLLTSLLETENVEQLLAWTREPAVVSFGKYRGLPWSDVPSDYLEWMIGEARMDASRLRQAHQELKRRADLPNRFPVLETL